MRLHIQCNGTRALELFNNVMNESDSAIVGCGCSLATEEIASKSDIPVVSFVGVHGTMEHCRNWSIALSVIVYCIMYHASLRA